MNAVERTSKALTLLAEYQSKLTDLGYTITSQQVTMRHWLRQSDPTGKRVLETSPADYAPSTIDFAMTARETETRQSFEEAADKAITNGLRGVDVKIPKTGETIKL